MEPALAWLVPCGSIPFPPEDPDETSLAYFVQITGGILADEPSQTNAGVQRMGLLHSRQEWGLNDELQLLRDAGYKPIVVGPQPFSFEELLRNVDPTPDEETERFVAAIYADRRQAAEASQSE